MTTTDLVWDDSASLAIPEIDDEHRTLYRVYNIIRHSLEREDGAIDLKGVCAELLSFTRDHFAREEALMAAHGYPGLEAHRKLHATFLQQIEDISTFVRTGAEPDDYLARFLVLGFIGKWIKMHTLVVDGSSASGCGCTSERMGQADGQPASACAFSPSR
ncbi:hemerythrin family protein [Azospirillum sp.]|uniref:hemerythrin family protein n=1 Tax=Azospirillum sp. TaxID=34012 RepID=UPI003D74A029